MTFWAQSLLFLYRKYPTPWGELRESRDALCFVEEVDSGLILQSVERLPGRASLSQWWCAVK